MLKIVSTPIGNLKDITLRAIEALQGADVIVAEDTREVIKLLKHFEIPPKQLISFYEEVESQKQDEILKLVQDDNYKGVLVSDAGTPLISDPGYKLVREAIKQGIQVDAIPGPCAAIDALVLSGLPPDKFSYWGFYNKKIQSNEGTNIYYVSPHRLQKFLAKLDQNLEIVVARELTKIYQEVWRGKVSDAILKFKNPRGEFIVLWHI